MEKQNYTLEPIGYVTKGYTEKYLAPEQGSYYLQENLTEITLNKGHNFQQALEGLEGFEMIWLIWIFSHAENWKVKIQTPRYTAKKIGVFATRSPHRPNHIGITACRLEKVEKLKLIVSGADLLEGTPIIDIKPYIPKSDAFPEVKAGWVDDISSSQVMFNVILSDSHKELIADHPRLQAAIELLPNRISRPKSYSRIKKSDDGTYTYAFKNFRIKFIIDKLNINVLEIIELL